MIASLFPAVQINFISRLISSTGKGELDKIYVSIRIEVLRNCWKLRVSLSLANCKPTVVIAVLN